MDNWSNNFRYALSDLQREYKISNSSIINSLSDAIYCKNSQSQGKYFKLCKIRLSFEDAVHKELPFHPSCYSILADIIREEIGKHQEGLGMPSGEFLTKIDLLDQLFSMITRRWVIQKRPEKEFVLYFNSVVRNERERVPLHSSPVLYDGFIKRWNKIYNPLQNKRERSEPGGSFRYEKRRRVMSSSVQEQPLVSPQTFPSAPVNSNPPPPVGVSSFPPDRQDDSSSSIPTTPNFSSPTLQNLFGSPEIFDKNWE